MTVTHKNGSSVLAIENSAPKKKRGRPKKQKPPPPKPPPDPVNCVECRQPLDYFAWNTYGSLGVCNTGYCSRFRQPQGWRKAHVSINSDDFSFSPGSLDLEDVDL